VKKLGCVDVKNYQVESSDIFAALENLDEYADISSSWESTRENINTSGKESPRYHKHIMRIKP